MASTTEEAIATLQDDGLPENTRKAAVHFLQYHPSDEGMDALVVGLRDRDSGVRWACSTALAVLGDKALIPLLRAIGSTQNDPLMREGAHHVLVHNASLEVRNLTKDLREALIGPGAEMSSMEQAAKLLLSM